MAAKALLDKRRVFPVGLQVHANPAGKAPTPGHHENKDLGFHDSSLVKIKELNFRV